MTSTQSNPAKGGIRRSESRKTDAAETDSSEGTQVQLFNDKDIAETLGVSKSWLRGQRHKRRHKLPHHFNIDPVMIGTLPRYRQEDVFAWINNLSPANDNRQATPNGDET
jgi:hypothetical protein